VKSSLASDHRIASIRLSSDAGCPDFAPSSISLPAIDVSRAITLDHSDQLERLAGLDALPTAEVWPQADAKMTQAFWPWSLLAQLELLPERLRSGAPDAVVESAIGRWGSPRATLDAEIRTAYVAALKHAAHVHAICEEGRAAATRDRADDDADRNPDRHIECPALVLWSGRREHKNWYGGACGLLAIWHA